MAARGTRAADRAHAADRGAHEPRTPMIRQGQARVAAFLRRLQELGWTEGSNVLIDIRWAAADADGFRRSATELVALAPDVILLPAPHVAALQGNS